MYHPVCNLQFQTQKNGLNEQFTEKTTASRSRGFLHVFFKKLLTNQSNDGIMILKEKQLQSNQTNGVSYNDYLRKYRASRIELNQRAIDFAF